MYKLYAVLVGIMITIMITFNGILEGYAGSYLSVFIIHIVGLISILIVLFIRKERFKITKGVPLYLYSGGAIGIGLVMANNTCFVNLGASLTLSLGIFGQIVLSSVIDHFALLDMEMHKFKPKKIIGLGIIVIGIIIMTIY